MNIAPFLNLKAAPYLGYTSPLQFLMRCITAGQLSLRLEHIGSEHGMIIIKMRLATSIASASIYGAFGSSNPDFLGMLMVQMHLGDSSRIVAVLCDKRFSDGKDIPSSLLKVSSLLPFKDAYLDTFEFGAMLANLGMMPPERPLGDERYALLALADLALEAKRGMLSSRYAKGSQNVEPSRLGI